MKRFFILLLCVILLVSLSACTQGVSEEEYNALIEKTSLLEDKLEQKDKEIAALSKKGASAYPGEISIGDGLTVYAFPVNISGEATGFAFCDFDGKNLEREAAILITVVSSFYESGIEQIYAYDLSGECIGTTKNSRLLMADRYEEFYNMDLTTYKEEVTTVYAAIVG